MSRFKPVLAVLAIPLCIIIAWYLATSRRPNRENLTYEGHIKAWLVLAPIPLEPGQSGGTAIHQQQIGDEANLRPLAGERIKVGTAVLEWREHFTRDYYLDFNDLLGGRTEHSLAYAVCYIHADTDMNDAMLMLGSDDQIRAYLNGVNVFTYPGNRSLTKDQDRAVVPLKKGVNVLVLKVINDLGDWNASARFTDRHGFPIRNLKVSLTGKLKE